MMSSLLRILLCLLGVSLPIRGLYHYEKKPPPTFYWRDFRDGQVPPNAISFGRSEYGQPLFIGSVVTQHSGQFAVEIQKGVPRVSYWDQVPTETDIGIRILCGDRTTMHWFPANKNNYLHHHNRKYVVPAGVNTLYGFRSTSNIARALVRGRTVLGFSEATGFNYYDKDLRNRTTIDTQFEFLASCPTQQFYDPKCAYSHQAGGSTPPAHGHEGPQGPPKPTPPEWHPPSLPGPGQTPAPSWLPGAPPEWQPPSLPGSGQTPAQNWVPPATSPEWQPPSLPGSGQTPAQPWLPPDTTPDWSPPSTLNLQPPSPPAPNWQSPSPQGSWNPQSPMGPQQPLASPGWPPATESHDLYYPGPWHQDPPTEPWRPYQPQNGYYGYQ